MDQASKMEIIFIALTTAATIAAAIAAWFSYNVSKKSLSFQKQVAKNQSIHAQLISIQNKIMKIRLNLNDIWGVSDEDFEALEPMFSDLKKEIETLNYQVSLDENICKLLRHSEVVKLEDDELDQSIKAIQNTLSEIWS